MLIKPDVSSKNGDYFLSKTETRTPPPPFLSVLLSSLTLDYNKQKYRSSTGSRRSAHTSVSSSWADHSAICNNWHQIHSVEKILESLLELEMRRDSGLISALSFLSILEMSISKKASVELELWSTAPSRALLFSEATVNDRSHKGCWFKKDQGSAILVPATYSFTPWLDLNSSALWK